MLKGSWKSVAFLASVASPALFLLALCSRDLFQLGWTSLAWCAPLLILTVAAGRLAVPVMSLDSLDQNQKSVANTFVFLAAVIYGPALATFLAAIDGLMRSRRASHRRVTVLSTSTAIVPTYIAVLFYELLTRFFAGEAPTGSRHLVESGHLLPLLCVLALVQYFLEVIAFRTFTAFLRNHNRALFSRETFVWASLMQMVSASSAALFY